MKNIFPNRFFVPALLIIVTIFSLLGGRMLGNLFSEAYFVNKGTSDVYAAGGDCEDADQTSLSWSDADTSKAYPAPSGNIVSGVCIKAGQIHSGSLGNGTYGAPFAEGCYTITGVGTNSVTITEIGVEEDPTCKDVSHIDLYLSDPSSPSPSPSSRPSPSPSASPSPSPSSRPSPSPSASPSPSPSGSPTATPTPTVLGDVCENIDGVQTSVPGGLHLDASGKNCVDFELGGPPSPPEAEGEVLGTQTGQVLGLSATSSSDPLNTLFFWVGLAMLTAGVKLTGDYLYARNRS